MSIKDRLFTRDIANAARERRERQSADVAHDRERLVVGPTTPPAFDGTPRPAPARPPSDRVAATVDRVAANAHRVAADVDRVAANVEPHAIFPGDEAGGLRARWEAIQTGFVDEPRASVEQADALVAQVVTRLAEVFSEERAQLEHQWDRGDNISTEDLRVALKRYRAFFDRLLSV